MPICCCLLGLSLPFNDFSIFFKHVEPLRLFWRILWTVFSVFWIIAIIINLHLTNSQVFLNVPFKVYLEQIRNYSFAVNRIVV